MSGEWASHYEVEQMISIRMAIASCEHAKMAPTIYLTSPILGGATPLTHDRLVVGWR